MNLVPLSKVCRIVNGGTPKSGVAEYWGGNVAWLTPAEMGKLDSPEIAQTVRTITAAGLMNSSANQVPVGSVIMSTRAPIGHLAIPLGPMAFNQGCRGLVPDERLDTKYLYYFLWFSREALNDLGTGTTFKELSTGALGSYEIPLPPLDEQRRIVALLDEAFAAIATATARAEKNLANAQDLFEEIVKEALTEEGTGWNAAPFEQCLDPISYPAKVQRKAFLTEGAYPIVSQEAAFINGYWDEPENLLRVPRPLVVFGDHTQVLKYVDFDFVLGADGVKLLLPKPWMSGKFLYYFLKANPVPSAGYARHYRHLKSLTVSYPRLAEQHVITNELDVIGAALEELVGMYRSKIEALTELKQSLLHHAFSGDLTEREPLAA